MVGATGFEPATSCSQGKRAKPCCATPRTQKNTTKYQERTRTKVKVETCFAFLRALYLLLYILAQGLFVHFADFRHGQLIDKLYPLRELLY